MRPESQAIRTYTGKLFWPADPLPEDLDIKDIAHALSNLCRYTGHVDDFYSVAQHCVLASLAVEKEHALCALLHDASEAYLNDIARPVKQLPQMQGYRDMEAKLEEVIAGRFGIPFPYPEEVHQADRKMYITERRDLFTGYKSASPTDFVDTLPYGFKIFPWNPGQAERAYLRQFQRITLKMGVYA